MHPQKRQQETSRKINLTSLTDTGKTMPNEEEKIIFKNKTIQDQGLDSKLSTSA